MTKLGDLKTLLLNGWVTVPELLTMTGWKSHTLRGALSGMAKRDALTVERRRVDGVTSYRIAAP